MKLDDLTDAELIEMLEALLAMRGRVALRAARGWAALTNELSGRAQARGLFDESTGRFLR